MDQFFRDCVSSLNRRLFLKFVEFYEILINKQTSDDTVVLRQKQALQILFDAKFVGGFLNWKQNLSDGETMTIEKRLEKILNFLENIVDPFDLDVMMPYVKRNVAKQIHKCQVNIRNMTNKWKNYH